MAEGMFKTLLWFIVVTTFVMTTTKATRFRKQRVPCYFVFGDSVFDNGNNNVLNTSAKVNYSPYGLDFVRGPTGRFSNGRNIPDFIAQLMRFKEYIPPFTGASPEQAHIGLNYASGGGGIREETSQHLGGRISLEKQIKNHESMIKKAQVPKDKLQKCLYTINIGSNDYLNNYFMSAPYNTSHMTHDQYAHSLIQSYRSHLKSLYDLGARKVALFGVSKLGCTPRMIASHGNGNGSCVAEINKAVEPFNFNLKSLVYEFNKNLTDAKFTFVDLYTSQTPFAFYALGFKVLNKSCCTVKAGEELCAAKEAICQDRRRYVYWDNVHSTEASNRVAAKVAFSGFIARPYGLRRLARLK